MGRGIGYIDVHLLASAALAAPTRLWTRDRRLANVADHLNLAFQPSGALNMARIPTSSKTIEALRHDEATRKNIPTAEYQSVMD